MPVRAPRRDNIPQDFAGQFEGSSQGYTIPQGLEGSEWEQYRRDQGITSINNDNRAGVYAGFELWKNNKNS